MFRVSATASIPEVRQEAALPSPVAAWQELGDLEIEFMTADIEREERAIQGRIYTGSHCEYITLSAITANSGCADGNQSEESDRINGNSFSGTKFVIKQKTGVRKQFLILNGTPILAFVTKGKKFKDCTSFTEVTALLNTQNCIHRI